MAKRRSMVDAATRRPRDQVDTPEQLVEEVQAKREQAASRKPPKTKVTISIDQELADELRAANDQLGRAAFPSISAVFEKGGYAELERLREQHNGGKPFK